MSELGYNSFLREYHHLPASYYFGPFNYPTIYEKQDSIWESKIEKGLFLCRTISVLIQALLGIFVLIVDSGMTQSIQTFIIVMVILDLFLVITCPLYFSLPDIKLGKERVRDSTYEHRYNIEKTRFRIRFLFDFVYLILFIWLMVLMGKDLNLKPLTFHVLIFYLIMMVLNWILPVLAICIYAIYLCVRPEQNLHYGANRNLLSIAKQTFSPKKPGMQDESSSISITNLNHPSAMVVVNVP
ncbi:hypothetical protein BC833DRAFT_621311 [Globomyces pollinis-pini]|nr:hypothetical protein BC833DRAFT_621311 [Globomyces pollinis-pini]